MGRRGHGVDRDDHGGARLEHRQRRAAGHVRHARRDHRGDHVGRHRVHPRAGDRHADHRAARGALRPQAFLHGERRALHARVDGVRTRALARR